MQMTIWQVLVFFIWLVIVVFIGYILVHCKKIKQEGVMPDIEDVEVSKPCNCQNCEENKSCQCED